MEKKNAYKTPKILYSIGICLLPLVLLIAFSLSAKNDFINNFFKTWTQIRLNLIINSFLDVFAFLVLLLCGYRIFGFIKKIFAISNAEKSHLSDLLASFIIGSLVAYAILMTVGVLGFYYTPVIWICSLLIVFFPIGLKDFFSELKDFIGSVKIKWDLGMLLFVSAIGYFGISLLLLQLTSPFPTGMDIMEVYNAPVARVLNFHRFIPENSMPFALYDELRSVPLHTAIYSFISALTGLSSSEGIAGSIIIFLFVALGSTYFLSRMLGGKLAGGVAAWLFAASVNIGHLVGGRSGLYCMFYFLPGFVFFLRSMLEKDRSKRAFFSVIAGLAFGSVTLMNTVIGAFVILSVFIVFLFSKFWISWKVFWEGGYTLVISAVISALYLFQFHEYLKLPLVATFFIVGGFTLLMVPVVFFLRTVSKTDRQIDEYPVKGWKLWIPGILFLITSVIVSIFKWKSPYHDETPYHNLLKLTPLLFTFGILGIVRILYFYYFEKTLVPEERYKSGAAILLATGIIISFSLCMYIHPLFGLTSTLYMSISREIPAKGLDFFIIPCLVVFGSLVISGIKNNIIRYAMIPFIIVLVVLPSYTWVKPLSNIFSESFAQRSFQDISQEQVSWAANGYFEPWDGDKRIPLSASNFVFIDHLKSLIRENRITTEDTIVHIAPTGDSWDALPFPVFTGIKQTILAVKRDPGSIYTSFGRLCDFPASFDYNVPAKWMLIEKSVMYADCKAFNDFLVKKYAIEFENPSIIFLKFHETKAPPGAGDVNSASGLTGDVNSNGIVDIVDALLIAKYYVGSNPKNFNIAVADVNASGAADIVDALLISKKYVGSIDKFPGKP